MNIKIGADGMKNCHITISGVMTENSVTPVPILFFAHLQGSPKSMRIDAIQFAIQEKMGFNLWWLVNSESNPMVLIMPVESRGGFDFEKIKPLQSPEGCIGIGFTAFKVLDPPMTFMLMLDMTKQ